MTTRHIVLALAAALPLAAIAACDSQSESERLSGSQPSQSYTEQQPMTLAMLDKDRDGMVSRSEAVDSSEIDERFHELDRDKDGQLSRAELDQASALPR
jgi:Ca2+-binding EF-hand superfamily protein